MREGKDPYGGAPLEFEKYYVEQPAKPNCRREKKPERQFRGCAYRTAQDKPARYVKDQRGERRDFNRDRNERPVEPSPGDRGELDVAKAHSMAMAQPQVDFPESEECKGQNKSTQRSNRDVFRHARQTFVRRIRQRK